MLSPISFVQRLMLCLALASGSIAHALATAIEPLELTADSLELVTASTWEEDSITWGRPCQDSHRVRWYQAAVPGALAVGGGILVKYQNSRVDLRQRLQSKGHNHTVRVDDYLRYVPYAANLFVGCTGVKSKHGLGGRMLMTATAAILQAGITNAIKYTVREKRPNASRRNAFPSGHTATAFTGAELCRIEYGWKVGGPAYAMAATVGFLRMWNDRHWYNDVLAGAAVGVLSAQAANWLYPLERKMFRPLERRIAERRAMRHSRSSRQAEGPRIMFAPTYDSTCAAPGMNFVACF